MKSEVLSNEDTLSQVAGLPFFSLDTYSGLINTEMDFPKVVSSGPCFKTQAFRRQNKSRFTQDLKRLLFV